MPYKTSPALALQRLSFPARVGQTLSVLLALNACGGSSSATAPAATPAEAPAAESPPAPTWESMDRKQRLEFMGLTVMPEMKKLMGEFDAESAKDFRCQSCHGDDMKDVDYKMPNGLYALSKANPIADSTDYDPDVTKFMAERFMPKMAELLGAEAGPSACFTCHDVDE